MEEKITNGQEKTYVPKAYKTILADPSLEHPSKRQTGSCKWHYELMPLERIKAMPGTGFSRRERTFIFMDAEQYHPRSAPGRKSMGVHIPQYAGVGKTEAWSGNIRSNFP